MKVKEWFRRFFAGMAIGTGAAIPGVSGAACSINSNSPWCFISGWYLYCFIPLGI